MNKLPFYSYYDYLENYYDNYYDENYWPKYYGVFNVSNDTWCHYLVQSNITYNVSSTDTYFNTSHVFNFTTTPNGTWFNNTYFNTTMAPNVTWYNNTVYTTANTPFNTPYDINVTFFNCTPHFNGTFPPPPSFDAWWFKDIWTVMLFMYPVIILCTILSFIIIILYFRKLSKANRRTKPDKLTTALTTVSLLSYLLYNIAEIVECVAYHIRFNLTLFIVSMCVWNFFWAVSKTMMYGLYAYRYYGLRTSAIANPLSKRKKVCVFATIVIIIWCQFLLALLHGVYEYMYWVTEWDDPQLPHIERVHLYSAWIVMGLDFILLFSFGYLVIYRILKVVIAMAPAAELDMTSTVPSHSMVSSTNTYDSHLNVVPSPKVSSKWLRVKKKSSADSTLSQDSQRKMRRQRSSSKQMLLIEVSARIAITSLFAMMSSTLIQFMWLWTRSNATHLEWITYWWSVDSVINMLCIYLSMGFAKAHYKKICDDCCKCHPCFMWCIMNIVQKKIENTIKKDLKELEKQNIELTAATIVTTAPEHVQQVSASTNPPSDNETYDSDDNKTHPQISICVDCGEWKTGRTYEENGEFYCDQCWSCYY